VSGIQAIADVVADAVCRGEEAREERGVRGLCEGAMRIGVLEEARLAAEAIDVGGGDAWVAVRGQTVGTKSVD
jgi:hypothetical protein